MYCLEILKMREKIILELLTVMIARAMTKRMSLKRYFVIRRETFLFFLAFYILSVQILLLYSKAVFLPVSPCVSRVALQHKFLQTIMLDEYTFLS